MFNQLSDVAWVGMVQLLLRVGLLGTALPAGELCALQLQQGTSATCADSLHFLSVCWLEFP